MQNNENVLSTYIEFYYILNPTMERIPVNVVFTDDLNRTH